MNYDLDSIFARGAEVLRAISEPEFRALAESMDPDNRWGLSFENDGFNVLQAAAPFLETGDKAGWLAACKQFQGPCTRLS
jgi:hypothetical protein